MSTLFSHLKQKHFLKAFLLMGLENGVVVLENSLAVLQLLISLLGIHPREMKTTCPHQNFTRISPAALFINNPKWKQPKCPSANKWINKM